ncbi:class I SAM-dependent DNA methyltransferase [Geminicoccus roseus]|uniref:class I SAM-dependent DNA methyltransferase n=1 Tax=Geminicoccus roseus TaxID=404900 RepID=UPI0006853CBF|nr:DNA methyltransferase [Geminicoccus roseus]
MKPEDFIKKWKNSTLKERSASQSHFNDLCRLLGVETPTEADQTGDWYCFERGASKTAGGEGWADVWKRGHFGWEYKGKKKDLTVAFAQLQQYAVALENPPLLVVSDMDRIIVHTNWTNTVSETHTIALDDLLDPYKRELLKWVFLDPERLKPSKTIDALTRDAADKFARLAITLRERGNEPQAVAHFINRLVFCMFAEDINLLPRHMFTQIIDEAFNQPDSAHELLTELFRVMKSGGRFGIDRIEWFNGGLFDDAAALPLGRNELKIIGEAAALDWSDIDPSIFGTLFERGLDPAKRSQLGAHYTDPEKIMMIVRPVVIEPLWQEWEDIKAQIQKPRTSEVRKKALLGGFLERLKGFRVLDPACGSGNFLYLALLALKDLEHRVNLEAEAMGLGRQFPSVGPEAVKGIELNPYAAELARVTIWIGEIQWMRKNGFDLNRQPILKPLNNIECRDALLNEDNTEATWPEADVIIGNPPFLGAKLMYRRLGRSETERIRSVFSDRLNGFTDLVCYWFEKAQALVSAGKIGRAGFVATKSIAKNTNLPVMIRLCQNCTIYSAWSNEPWIVDGAAVRVSIINFCKNLPQEYSIFLDNNQVTSINPDLTSGNDLTIAKNLPENRGYCFVGIQKSGPLEVDGSKARDWMNLPSNPNGKKNSYVLKPYWNGDDIVGRSRDVWLVDIPIQYNESEASLFEEPFKHISEAPYDPPEDNRLLKAVRSEARDEHARNKWWLPYWPRPEMRRKISAILRYIVTPMTSEHRVFYWLHYPQLPDNNLVVIARDDDVQFGILSSSIHEKWATARGNRMGAGNQRRYNGTSIYETFPFPEGLTPDVPVASYIDDPRAERIAFAASRLDELRNNWLNPTELVKRVPELAPGFPDRFLPVDDKAAAELRKRTLTNLYNQRPAWLLNAHKVLDEAVAAAYGWPADLSDDEILARLLALNLERAAAERASPHHDSGVLV